MALLDVPTSLQRHAVHHQNIEYRTGKLKLKKKYEQQCEEIKVSNDKTENLELELQDLKKRYEQQIKENKRRERNQDQKV